MGELDAGSLGGSLSMDNWDLGSDDSSDDQTQEPADDSRSSDAYDRYGTDAYNGNVGSGAVAAANPSSSGQTDHQEQVQSAQLEQVESVSGGGKIDNQDVTVNDDGSASFGITGGAVDEVQADADGNVIDPNQGINLPSIGGIDLSGKMLAIGAVLIGAVAYLFGGN